MRRTFMLKQMVVLLFCLLAAAVGSPVARAEDGRCPPAPLKDVETLLGSAQEKLLLVDYAAALSTLDQAEQKIPCVSESVSATVLTRLNIYRGLNLFYLGNVEGAKLAFIKALAIDPNLKWDTKYGQRPREAFLDAKEQALGRGQQNVRCPLLAAGVQVYLNGRELTQGESITLSPGSHLLQIRWGDGHWEGNFFELASGREIPLPLPRQALLSEKRSGQSGSGQVKPPETGSDPIAVKHPAKIPEDTHSEESGGSNLFKITGAISAGSLLTSAAFGAVYLSTRKQLCGKAFGECNEGGGQYFSDLEDAEKDSLINTNKIAAIGADVALGLGVVAAGATVYFYLHRDADQDSEVSQRMPTFLVPTITRDTVGLLLHHEF